MSKGKMQLNGWTEGAEVMDVAITRHRIDTITGIVFSQVKSLRNVRALRMTAMIPRFKAAKPAVIYFPGGGWSSSDHDRSIELRYALARAGFAVFACEYRTIPARFPAQLEDAKSAVRFVRAHAAEYGVDPLRIGVTGDSAGGWLAAMVALTGGEPGWDRGDFLSESSAVQACATVYGVSDLLTIREGLPHGEHSPAEAEALLVNGADFGTGGCPIDGNRQAALAASPLGHVQGARCPMLILHGTADTVVAASQSARLFAALRAQGADVRYVLVRGANHNDLHWFQDKPVQLMAGWFIEKLGDPLAGPQAEETRS